MGNTIRRQPITFNIPKEPDYQFLNVLDFRGLKLTDNPFTADSNTASDALNVYVDEANALATRPRLELFLSKFSDMTSVYNIYNIKDGFLVHYLKGSVPSIDIILSDGFVRKSVTGTIPTGTKLSVFEQNDIIYVLDGNKYYNIINYVSSEVEGHIPTTRVGMTNKTEGSSYEDLNILTDKYKETYFWDGTWDISFKDSDVVNNYVENILTDWSTYTNGLRIVKYLPLSSTDNNKVFLWLRNDSTTTPKVASFGFVTINTDGSVIEYTEIPAPPNNLENFENRYDVSVDCSDDGNYLAVRYSVVSTQRNDFDEINGGGIYIGVKGPNNVFSWTTAIEDTTTKFSTKGSETDFEYHTIKISENGNSVLTCSDTELILLKKNNQTNNYDKTTYENSPLETRGIVVGDNFNSLVLISYDSSRVMPYHYNLFRNISTEALNKNSTISAGMSKIIGLSISSDSTFMIYCVNDEIRLQKGLNLDTLPEFEILPSVIRTYNANDFSADPSLYTDNYLMFKISKDGDKCYYWQNVYTGSVNQTHASGWIDVENKNIIHIDNIVMNQFYSSYINMPYATRTNFINYNVINNDLDRFLISQFSFDFDSEEPLLTVTKTLSIDDDLYSNWNERRNKFLKSFLTTRFNNERWFASGSRLYYTSNNDPSYIGLFNYNDLGESDEDITGFNLAEDTLLIVYKDTRVHSVQYTAVGDEIYTYVYSDSQNVVGNNAIGASIVTALTEVPIQISYDGIYALAQLKNVQSSTRISQSISEDIDKKWLKENKNSIKHALTMNRLYWTYVILDEVDSAGDPIFSKVYLLDNRHNSWFYWEFPIRIINAFSKNNTTHFIGSDGNIYVLRTTDIINEYNPDLLEYYDLDKQVIKWKWKSQILPMKTINYSKKLITTTFILSDTDENDEYGLQYKFKAFRKMASETQETTLTNRINYVVSTTKRTLIPRYNFMQLELLNIEDDLNNNKLRLIGLGFKYVLLEGML